MANKVGVSLGNSMFLNWDALDSAVNRWAKSYFGEHVEGQGNREADSFGIEFTGLFHSDFEKYSMLFDKYDTEKNYEPEYEFAVGHVAAILPADMSKRLMPEVLGETGLVACGTAMATYNGVFFMERDRYGREVPEKTVVEQAADKPYTVDLAEKCTEKAADIVKNSPVLARMVYLMVDYDHRREDVVSQIAQQELDVELTDADIDKIAVRVDKALSNNESYMESYWLAIDNVIEEYAKEKSGSLESVLGDATERSKASPGESGKRQEDRGLAD